MGESPAIEEITFVEPAIGAVGAHRHGCWSRRSYFALGFAKTLLNGFELRDEVRQILRCRGAQDLEVDRPIAVHDAISHCVGRAQATSADCCLSSGDSCAAASPSTVKFHKSASRR